MKVILIKIYGEEEEMVHVSVVSGTPLGLGDMTVISQITDHWRDGARRTAPFAQTFRTRSRRHLNARRADFTRSHQDYLGFSMQFTPPSHFKV